VDRNILKISRICRNVLWFRIKDPTGND